MKSFNVIFYDVNNRKFISCDVIPYFVDQYKASKPKNRPKTKEELKKFIKEWSMYRFWARCEYEMILSSWPPSKNESGEKWDIHKQLMMNLDVLTDLVAEIIKI